MLTLTGQFTLDREAVLSPNLCDRFSKEDLQSIGQYVLDTYKADKESREPWERRNSAAMNLALQLQEEKNFPWPGCSNVAFPLLTIAALQFHSRAYPAIVNGRKVVECRVIGPDPTGAEGRRAAKISRHMSWQLLEDDESWEEDTDRSLINVAIIGCGFKKTYYDPEKGKNVSRFVPANKLICNYWARSIESCPAKTEILTFFKNDIYTRVKSGMYRDVLDSGWYKSPSLPEEGEQESAKNERTGINRPHQPNDIPFTILEQHCSIDLDQDGYAEPYIITFEESSGEVLRIVTRFDRWEDVRTTASGEIISIRAMEYYTKIPFVPNPDGSLLDIGFGTLIGPLNESVNTSINQLIDAGTMANTAGGFLGRGAKIRGGVYTFSPFQWNRVDSTGDDLQKSIMPLPVREPSGVLFNLLSLLIDYTNRVSGSTDILAGENPGQNTPAETSRSMVEQGQKIYSAIFKRIWRSLKQEFKKMYILNGIHLGERVPFGAAGEFIGREDYRAGDTAVVPAADPLITSDGARFAKARMLREAADSAPGYNRDAVERTYLESMGFDSPETFFAGTEGVEPPEDVKVTIQKMKNEAAAQRLQFEQLKFIMTMQEQQRMNAAKIVELNAKALKIGEEARTTETEQRIQAFNAAIGALRENNQQLGTQINKMMEDMDNDGIRDADSRRGIIQGLVTSPNDQVVPPAPAPSEGGA